MAGKQKEKALSTKVRTSFHLYRNVWLRPGGGRTRGVSLSTLKRKKGAPETGRSNN